MIVAEGLGQTYTSLGRPLRVLTDINLTVEAEGFVAVVGPSGSGKTTLLGLLAGLDRPSEGRVFLDGDELNPLDEDRRARIRAEKVGFVFQNFQLIPTLTALENVMVPVELLRAMGGPRTERSSGAEQPRHASTDRGIELLGRVGLGDRLHHYPAQLSGGEQQRVALARAFANRPRILFADEPTGNLDAETGATVIDLLVRLNREEQTTLVLVTHDTELASRAHRIVRLAGGRILPSPAAQSQ